MDVVFTKGKHQRHFPPWVAHVGKMRVQGTGPLGSSPWHTLPHDMVTFVVERDLRIDDGFFATVAGGGTFRSLGKKRHTAGKAVIARNRTGLDRAELVVHEHGEAWLRGDPTACGWALDRALADWLVTPPGGSVTMSWDLVVHGPPKRRRRR